jgi:hypothetical protein
MGPRIPLLRRSGDRSADGRPDALERQARAGWLGPQWLERQADPDSPVFVPVVEPGGLRNLTRRNWTTVGNLDSPWAATVDPAGLVTPIPGGWSLDWWIGAEDRWHLPSREATVRQALVGDAPVVETRLRVPGGDAVHRAYAVRAPGPGGEAATELVVVEIENDTSVPFAVAVALRPYHPTGAARLGRIEIDGTTVVVDGRPALLLPKAPGRSSASTFDQGDSAWEVLSGRAGEGHPPTVSCADGMAQAALLFPLAHRATLRFALPLGPPPARPAATERPAASLPDSLPTAAQVASGWEVQSRRGLRVELPDPRLQAAFDSNRRYLLVFHRTPGSDGPPGISLRDAAHLLGAMDRCGFHAEAGAALAGYAELQRSDGAVAAGSPEPAGTGAALAAVARHWELAHDRALLDEALPWVARGLAWLDRTRRRRMATVPGADLWGAAGMHGGSVLLDAADEPRGAEDARRGRDEFLASWSVGDDPEGLVAVWPLGLVEPGSASATALADAVRDGAVQQDAVRHDLAGLGIRRTLLLAGAELAAGDPQALERLRWVLDTATATWTWPEVVHPRSGGGSAGEGHDAVAASLLVTFVRDVLVREVGGGGLALSSLVPAAWYGQGWEVHDAPTAHGRLSYAVRWHGERPALLWELDPHPGSGPVRITAPGLDPTWSSDELRGDALLAKPPGAPEAAVGIPAAGESFG